jgi:outer membrane protein
MIHAALFIAAAAASAAPITSTVTLSQCYDWARERSEELRVRREDVEVSRQRARASLAGALPRLEWELVDTFQDPDGVRELQSQGFGGFVQREQIESKFSLTQPLFSGLREHSARSGFKREKARDELLLSRAEKRLYERTAELFFGVLAQESEAASTAASLRLATSRARELEGFLRLGKARDSEVFSAQAQAAALRASLEAGRARIGTARDELSRLTRRDLSEAPLSDEPAPTAPPPVDEALARARSRADVRALREDLEAKRRRVAYERGLYWPSVDAVGNYYTRRAAPFMRAIDWDVQLKLNVPIFQGGAVSASVKSAQAAERAALASLEGLEADVEASVRKLHRELAATLEQSSALDAAARAARDAYDALMKEYRLGLTTNLEVLAALDQLQAQSLARDAARFRLKRLAASLAVAVESAP